MHVKLYTSAKIKVHVSIHCCADETSGGTGKNGFCSSGIYIAVAAVHFMMKLCICFIIVGMVS